MLNAYAARFDSDGESWKVFDFGAELNKART